MKRFAILAIVIGALVALSATSGLLPFRLSPKSFGLSSREAERVEYVTERAAMGRIRRTISATGALRARATVDVSSQLSGQIARVEADFNDVVAAGQLLAELDRRSFEARVAQAEAESAMARETIAILATRLDRAQSRLDEAGAEREVFAARIDRARALVRSASRQRARGETLRKQGTATVVVVEDALSAEESARAELREAVALEAAHKHAMASLEAGIREAEAELVNARAALPLRAAALDLVRLDLERSAIRSPIDGVVVGRTVEPGQTVAVSLDAPVLFTIAGDLAQMEIHASIDESDIGQIAVGQDAIFTVNAFPGQEFSARVVEIRKFAQVLKGVVTYTVVLETDNPDGRLLTGMTSTVRVVIDDVGPILTVPLGALRFAPDGTAPSEDVVWVLGSSGTPEMRRVVLGPDDRRDVAVTDGDLQAGDAVIVGRTSVAQDSGLFGIRF